MIKIIVMMIRCYNS